MNRTKHRGILLSVAAFAALIHSGCKPDQSAGKLIKKPRPVEVATLTDVAPPSSTLVTAPVASWKTEQIGMEVGGRIEWVVEPNTNIEGRVRDKDGNTIIEGTPIARVDPERYRLQVQSANSQFVQAQQRIEAAEIELNKTMQAQMSAAQADERRARIELQRSKRLVEQKAGAQADVDRDEASLSNAVSQIEQLQANMKAKEAEIESLNSQLLQARDSLRDAERSLEDCTLYSSFRGQIADVMVVPGSVVTAGQPVAQIQMMDPIKVEVEVSGADSRRLRNRQRLPVRVTREDGTTEVRDGFLYLVDSVADPQTRTFTLTLLMMNRRISDEASTEDEAIPTINQTWRVDFQFLPGASEGKTYASQDAIYQDENGPYVWRVNNMKVHGNLPKGRLIKVSKLPVELGESQIPFLGNWMFQEIRASDPTFDPSKTLIAGKLNLASGDPEQWNGDTVKFQNEGQWMLRPGDLVKVDLSNDNVENGVFVPMDALAYEAGKTFLFLLQEASDGGSPSTATVKKVEVIADTASAAATSALLPVRPADENLSLIGQQYVSRGAHYLRDGEPVRVVQTTETESEGT